MKSIFRRIFEEHTRQNYIYTLEETVQVDHKLATQLHQTDEASVSALERWVGEARIEMLYESADAGVLGLGLSPRLRHEIFLDYLDRKMPGDHELAAGRQPRSA